MAKKNETYVSYEIKAIITTIDMNKIIKETKTKNKMIINDIEYNFMKKNLQSEYGIGFHFEELDKEVEKILGDNNE